MQAEQRPAEMSPEEHKAAHKELHNGLDILVADWIAQTKNLPSQATVLDLMTWSYEQTLNPTNAGGM